MASKKKQQRDLGDVVGEDGEAVPFEEWLDDFVRSLTRLNVWEQDEWSTDVADHLLHDGTMKEAVDALAPEIRIPEADAMMRVSVENTLREWAQEFNRRGGPLSLESRRGRTQLCSWTSGLNFFARVDVELDSKQAKALEDRLAGEFGLRDVEVHEGGAWGNAYGDSIDLYFAGDLDEFQSECIESHFEHFMNSENIRNIISERVVNTLIKRDLIPDQELTPETLRFFINAQSEDALFDLLRHSGWSAGLHPGQTDYLKDLDERELRVFCDGVLDACDPVLEAVEDFQVIDRAESIGKGVALFTDGTPGHHAFTQARLYVIGFPGSDGDGGYTSPQLPDLALDIFVGGHGGWDAAYAAVQKQLYPVAKKNPRRQVAKKTKTKPRRR